MSKKRGKSPQILQPEGRKLVSSSWRIWRVSRGQGLRQVTGGAYRDRTDDPLLAKQVLSQLS